MKFLIFNNYIDEKSVLHEASGENPVVIDKPQDFSAPSITWEPLDQAAHACLVAAAERKWAALLEAAEGPAKDKMTANKKAAFIAARVLPVAPASKAQAAASAPAKDELDGPLTLKEFGQGKKR